MYPIRDWRYLLSGALSKGTARGDRSFFSRPVDFLAEVIDIPVTDEAETCVSQSVVSDGGTRGGGGTFFF